MKIAGAISPLLLATLAGGCSAENSAALSPAAPLSCEERLSQSSQEIALTIAAEQGRQVPVTLFVPAEPGTYPVAAFSHGAFASPTRYRALLAPLAGAGYIVIAPMHIDSEEFGSPERPSPLDTWNTRNLDMALALTPSQEIKSVLAARDLAIDEERILAIGHSYGALMAQIPGGAIATGPDGKTASFRNYAVDAVIGWSPPGVLPGMISQEGWNTLTVPSLTITGTTDVLPGFIDDWRAHKASFENAPQGNRAVWVGEGIDHYFGGMFGREKPADDNSQRLFQRALAVSLNFMDRGVGRESVCTLGEAAAGETYQED